MHGYTEKINVCSRKVFSSWGLYMQKNLNLQRYEIKEKMDSLISESSTGAILFIGQYAGN